MQDTEWEDVVVGNNIADTDWEDVKPVTQSVLDDRDGKVYNVPLAMDGIDTAFAIDTQHKGADKGSFFGKVFMDVAKMSTALTTGSMAAKSLPNEVNFERLRAPVRGFVGSFEGFVDNALVRATDLRQKQRIAAGKTYQMSAGDPLRDMAFDWEMPTEEERAEAQKLVNTAQEIRKANKDWWKNTKQAIKPEEEMDELDKFNEQLGAGFGSLSASMGSMVLFKNPTLGAAVIAKEFGAITANEYMDKALEQGMDYDEAYTLAFGRGSIEAGLELVADQAIAKIANLKAIQDISNRVISGGLIKAAQSKLGKEAIKKIGTRNTNSVFGAVVQGFATEGGTEGLQEALGMFYDNLTGVEDYSLDQILSQTLMSIIVGGITGGVAGGGGTVIYNRETIKTNERIKNLLQEQTPELSAEETQVMADAIQEMLFQESTGYMQELNNVMQKELAPDTRAEGLTPEQLTAETRKLLKEKYKMTDEQIDQTIKSSLSVIDARSQFNEAYTIFNEGLSNAGRDAARADAEARILAVRALAVARAEGTQVKDVLDRWNLQFRQTAWNEADIDKGAKNVAVKNVGYADFRNFIDEESNPVTEEVFNKIKEAISTYGNNIGYEELMDKVGKELDADMNAASMSNSDFMEVFDYIAEPNQQALLQHPDPEKYYVLPDDIKNQRLNILTFDNENIKTKEDVEAEIQRLIDKNTTEETQDGKTISFVNAVYKKGNPSKRYKVASHIAYSSKKNQPEIRNNAVFNINDLIKNSVFVEEDTQKQDKRGYDKALRFYTAVRAGNEIYPVRIVALHKADTDSFDLSGNVYDVIFEEKEQGATASLPNKLTIDAGSLPDTISISDLLQSVKSSDGRTYYQGGEERNLVAVHSISAGSLEKAIDFGGFAVPSIAIVNKNQEFHFDDQPITLVGNKEMIDPYDERNEVYNRDIWSKTFPSKTYKNPTHAKVKKFKDKFKEYYKKTVSENTLDSFTYVAEYNNPVSALNEFIGSSGAIMYYLENVKKEKVELPKRDKSADYLFNMDEELANEIRGLDASENREEISNAVKRMIDREVERKKQKIDPNSKFAEKIVKVYKETRLERDFDSNGLIYFGVADSFVNNANRYFHFKGKEVLDHYDVNRFLREKIKDDAKYEDWAVKTFEDELVGEPMVQVGNKLKPFTLENVVDAMVNGATVATQESVFFASGKIIASGAKKLESISDIREEGKKLVTKEQSQKNMDEINEQINEFTQYFMNTGSFETNMDRKNASGIALARVVKNKNITKDSLSKALNRELVEKKTYPDDVLSYGVTLANNIKEMSRYYFEAKPQRAVGLNEFSGAIIPTDPEFDAIAKKVQDNGLKVVRSDDQVEAMKQFENAYFQDKTNPQGPRGAYRNSIIYLFENADASTIIHELGHFFLDDMQKFADNETTKRQLEAIYKFVGSTDGKLTPEQHEYFANAFELYLMEGRAPNKVLEGVFVRFKRWLGRMWAEIKRISYVKLTPEIRKVFDEMLGGRGLDFAMQMSGAKMAEALESGTIPANVIAKAVQLLEDGKMSRADMDDLIARMKTGELKRKDFNQELKKFETGNVKHNERLNPFDKVKYKDILSKGNFSKKDVLEKINRLLKWSEPRSQNGKLVGRFSNLKMNQQFDHIRELMNMDKALAKEKLDENVKLINAMIRGEETGDMDSLVFDNKILTIRLNKASASMLIDVYNAISDSYNMGRLTTAVTGEARKARKNRMIQETKDVITGDGQVNWRKEQSKVKQFVNQLGLSQVSWQGILDILSMNDKSSKTGQSKLSKELDVFDAQQKEAQGVADDGEKASKLMEKRLKGVGNSAISVSRYVNTKLEEKFTIEWNGSKKTFTKDQLLDIYMKSKDPETKKMMAEDKVLRYDDSFLFEVNQVLTAEDRAIADALFEFYDENYEKVNAFYEEKYGVSLGKRAFYSPRSMERGGINVDTGDLSSYVGFSATKERKAKAGAVKIKGAFQVLQDYIINSNHWIAWSDKLIDINAVMGDVEIKNMIRNLFGENMEKRIAYEVSRMASNDKFQSKFGYGKLFNKIRSNYAIAALAAKPSLMIKQLTSFPAYWEHMSTAEFMTGLADFAVHMKEAVETLGNTTLMKTRDVNIIKDFEELSKSELFKKNANKVKLRELLMANIKLGDRGAIYMGGWALYKAELKKNLAKGMSEADAKAKALEKFERVTDETQQSGRLSQQSYWQSNPFLRAFTMFQSSQNQYLRKEINAIRGLLTGRADGKQAAKALFIFHVLLPCFFQYASDGFDWDEKAQLRAALLGSLNGIFILNGILERGLDYALGTADAWKATSTTLRDVIPFWGSGEDLAKFFIDFAEGDIDLEDYVEVMRAFGKPIGELTGIPVKYPLDVIQNFGSYAEEGEVKKEVLLWLGWSPYALRDKEED